MGRDAVITVRDAVTMGGGEVTMGHAVTKGRGAITMGISNHRDIQL